ncbi:MAG: hypothetical protein J0I36_15980 [Pandoraea sp.]|nr:hypothetical protein [Pandoraea sp.]
MAYKALDDARIALQRALSEPPMVSRRAARWWPALVALERVANAITDIVPRAGAHDAQVNPGAAVLTRMAAAIRHGGLGPAMPSALAAGIDPGLDEALRAAIGVLFGDAKKAG